MKRSRMSPWSPMITVIDVVSGIFPCSHSPRTHKGNPKCLRGPQYLALTHSVPPHFHSPSIQNASISATSEHEYMLHLSAPPRPGTDLNVHRKTRWIRQGLSNQRWCWSPSVCRREKIETRLHKGSYIHDGKETPTAPWAPSVFLVEISRLAYDFLITCLNIS